MGTLSKINNKNALGALIVPLFIAFVAFPLATISPVLSDEVTDLQDEIEQAEGDKDTKESLLDEIQGEIDKIANSGLSISAKIAALDEQLDELQGRLDEKEEELAEKVLLLDQKQEEANAKLTLLQSITAEAYKTSRVGLMDVLLAKNNGEDFFRAFSLHKIVAKRQDQLIAEILKEIEELEDEREELDEALATLSLERSALDEAMAALRNEQARIQQEIYAKALLERAVKDEIAKINKQLNNLSSELRSAIDAKVGSGGDTTGGGNYSGGTSPQPPLGNAGVYDIYIDGTKVKASAAGPIRLVGVSDPAIYRVNGSLIYRDTLEMRADSNMYLINELPFEQYLYGLGEVPSSWPVESLKAQAVAGRTYALQNWSKRTGYGYNLRDDVFDQNYVGVSKEVASYGGSWVSAVSGTSGKVVTSGGSLIATYYSSTCGGHSLSTQEVWGGVRSYAVGEQDWTSSTDSYGDLISYGSASSLAKKKWCGSSWQSCGSGDNINDAQMLDLANATIYLTKYPSQQNDILPSSLGGLSAAQIKSALGAESIESRIGSLTNVQSIYNNGSTQITPSVRKTDKVRMSGSSGTYDLLGTNFWTVFNSRAPGSLHIFYSNFWTPHKEGSSWNFYTRGYGHRVGMCQYGAYGRAQAGQSYEQILTHYYRSTAVTSNGDPGDIRVGITRAATGDITISSYNGKAFAIYANGQLVDGVTGSQSVRVVRK